MTVGTLTIGRKKFVVIPEKEYRQLKKLAGMLPDESIEQDLRDSAELRRRKSAGGKPVPLAAVRKRLGL
jgi:hypothetical protein